MRETRSSGSVRGASGDGRPYRERVLPVAPRPGQGLLSDHVAAAQPWRRERVFVPLKRLSRQGQRETASGGYLPLAPGASTVRYPIPQRTFKYVATVQVVTDEMCQLLTSVSIYRLAPSRNNPRHLCLPWGVCCSGKAATAFPIWL
jgi:hypothetical protein